MGIVLSCATKMCRQQHTIMPWYQHVACLALPRRGLWLAEAVAHSPPLWLKQLFTRVSIRGLRALSLSLSLFSHSHKHTHTHKVCTHIIWTGFIQASISSSSLCLFPQWRLWFTAWKVHHASRASLIMSLRLAMIQSMLLINKLHLMEHAWISKMISLEKPS